MAPKLKRSTKSKLPVVAVAGDGDSKQDKPRSSASVGSADEHDEEELADIEGPPRVNVVEGQSAAGDPVVRNLLSELDEEAEDAMSDTDLTPAIEEVKSELVPAVPNTPVTRAVNSVPVKMDPTVPKAVPARMIEVIMAKHEGLKYLQVTRSATGADVRDPGFTSMKTQQQVLHGIISVFATAGYSVTILDHAKILKVNRDKLVAGGQAIYDLFLRHQSQRKIEQAMQASHSGLIGADALKSIAESYVGRSRDDVKKLEEDLMLKEKMLKDLEGYLQDFADQVAAEKAAAVAKPVIKEVKSTEAKYEPKEDRKEEYVMPRQTSAVNAVKVSTDYLADIYDDCIGPAASVNATSRLRQSAVADLKAWDGHSRDEFRGRAHLSSVRTAFRLDGLTPGEACLQFPETLTGKSKIWYRQLPKSIRSDWKKLQVEFEQEYCGGTMSAQQRYYDMRRKPDEEPIDYLYRLNVQAIEAGVDFHAADGPSHVTHFLDTCGDPDLARQFGLAKPKSEADLRAGLKELSRQTQRAKRDEAIKARADKRESKMPKPVASGSKQRPILVNALNRLRATLDAAAGDDKSDSAEDDDEWPSDSEGDEPEPEEDLSTSTIEDLSSMLQPKSVEALAAVIAALQGREKTTKAKIDAAKQQHACSHCGSKKHSDRDCWGRITCTVCGRLGHPAEYCYHRCKGCGNVHDRGACPLEEIVNNLKTWFDPSKHAGVLPAEVEKWLN